MKGLLIFIMILLSSNANAQFMINSHMVNNYQVVARVNAGGGTVTATDGKMDWQAANINGNFTSGNLTVVSGEAFNTSTVSWTRHNSIPSDLPDADYQTLYDTERWDASGGSEMSFAFSLGNGRYRVRLYVGEYYSGASVGHRVYDVTIEGALVGDNIDAVSLFGVNVSGSLLYDNIVVTDGVLNITWIHQVENPQVVAVEIEKFKE